MNINKTHTRFIGRIPQLIIKGCALFLILGLGFNAPVFGQNKKSVAKTNNKYERVNITSQLRAITTAESEPNHIYFRKDLKMDVSDVFTQHKAAFGLSTNDVMSTVQTETCSLGDLHHSYQQLFKGYPVEGSSFILHEKAGKLESGNGVLIPGLKVNTTPTLSEAAALQLALVHLGASTYTWENPVMENWIKTISGDSSASWYPKGKLVIVNPKMDFNPDNYHFAYYFNVSSDVPFEDWNIYVDAQSGQVIKQTTNLISTNHTGSAKTVYSGTRTIKTSKDAGEANYKLLDGTRGGGIHTYDVNRSNNWPAAVEFLDADNDWNNVNASKDEYATDVHWALEMSYDYFKNVHGLNSYNGSGKLIRAYVHMNSATYTNAFFRHIQTWADGTKTTEDIFGFGDGDPADGWKPLMSLDITGHEFGHAVTKYATPYQGVPAVPVGLEYQDESGAINEAFSDIWGSRIEMWARPDEANWKMGEEVSTNTPPYLRHVAFPKLGSCPSTYMQDKVGQPGNPLLGTHWHDINDAGDHGGVHTNCGVGSYWFYLLCVGGSDKNDKGDKYTVESIGMAKAEKIAYRTLQIYLTRNSNYADFRTQSIKAVKDLYCTPGDECCFELQQVINAWYACGVGDPLLMFEEAKTEPTACDEATGKASVTVKGVKGTPEYLWSTGDTTNAIDSLIAGEYTVTVTDTSSGCTIDTILEVEEDVNFTMMAYGYPTSDCGLNDGSAKVYVFNVNGEPDILWSNGKTTAEITGLAPGSYNVMVTDTHTLCVKDTTVDVEEWEPTVVIQGGGNRTYCKGDPPPSITLSAQAYIGDSQCLSCTYLWSTGATGKSITVSSPGPYSVTATVFTNCKGSASTNVSYWERDCDDPDEPEWEIPIIRSSDPNDITGPLGYGPQKFVRSVEQMEYRIRYENDPDFATAPALKVVITMPFHNNAQMFSFRLGDFGFGNFLFDVPENTSFYTNRLDVSDSLGVLLDVTAGINVAQQQAFWIFNSIDPITGLEPTDASLGYLPVNDSISHRGEGFVNFTMTPKPSTTSGDTISEKAIIVFDINEEIPTNMWVNTIDAIAPQSSVDSLRSHSDSTTIRIRISGTDDASGSGIGKYALYFSKDSNPFSLYGEFPADTGIYFTGDAESEYEFFSLAIDNVGNTEPMKLMGESVTILHETPVSFWNIFGRISYLNTDNTPINDATIQLADTGISIAGEDITDGTGYFEMQEIREGKYGLTLSTNKTWGGGNAIDALMIAKHFAGISLLGSVEEGAADVNASGFVNSVDAQLTATRFVNLIDDFAAGDWYFHTADSIDLRSDTVLAVRSLCFGDVNGSFIPGSKNTSSTMSLKQGESVTVHNKKIIDLPISVTEDLFLGSVSLVLNYPEDQMDILSVSLAEVSDKNLFWHFNDGSLRLAWFDIGGLNWQSGETLLNIKVAFDDLKGWNDLNITLGDESQLSDPEGKIYNNVVLSIPKLLVNEISGFGILANNPNPFTHQTEISFEIPLKSKVKLSVINSLGELVSVVLNKRLEAGQHTVTFDAANLPSGVYICTMETRSAEGEINVSKRMVLSRTDN